jgi:hypothetical protein
VPEVLGNLAYGYPADGHMNGCRVSKYMR